eukprot:6688890-Pyramimonas_sp.AAC.1
MQDARVYSHDGPIRYRMRGYILTTDQSDAGCAVRKHADWHGHGNGDPHHADGSRAWFVNCVIGESGWLPRQAHYGRDGKQQDLPRDLRFETSIHNIDGADAHAHDVGARHAHDVGAHRAHDVGVHRAHDVHDARDHGADARGESAARARGRLSCSRRAKRRRSIGYFAPSGWGRSSPIFSDQASGFHLGLPFLGLSFSISLAVTDAAFQDGQTWALAWYPSALATLG